MKILSKITRYIKGLWFRKYFVLLDGRSNSVTISQSLYNHIMRFERSCMEVLMFKSGDTGLYSFCMREDFPILMQSETNFCVLQYNDKYHKIGFRSDHPSVTALLDEYDLPLNRVVFLTVLPRKTAQGEVFYEIQRPK